MNKQDHNDTLAGDIAVELNNVAKIFRQRQRTVSLAGILKNMIKPEIRQVQALDGVNLQIRKGEIVAYAGPNGAGKSTTVKLVSGLLAPNSGSVRVLGIDPIRSRTKCVNRIGVVFGQRTELWWDQPLAATFEWKRVVWDIPRDRYDRMLEFVKDLLGLKDYFNSLVRELSLGQRMRADLGLALMHEPEILLLDEPTIGVDVLAKRNILRFINDLNREKKVTVLVTSHDMSDLEQLAGRIVLISHGKIAFDGDFEQLRARFSDKRTLVLRTAGDTAPEIAGAKLLASEGGRHEYSYNPSKSKLTELLEQAAMQTEILDMESHQAPIDDVIADIYESWQRPVSQVV